jgi:hypothetical protein
VRGCVLFTTPPDAVALSLFVGAFWSILTSVSVLTGDCLLAGLALLLAAATREGPVPASCMAHSRNTFVYSNSKQRNSVTINV